MKKIINSLLLIFFFSTVSLSQSGYIKDWLILGPFPNNNSEQILLQKYIDEENVIPRGGLFTGNRLWKTYHSHSNYIDFHDPILSLDPVEYCVVYCAFYIYSESKENVFRQISAGSDDGLCIICNGKEALINNSIRGHTFDSDKAILEFKPGWNIILLKISNITGGFFASARIENMTGLKIQSDCPFKYEGKVEELQITPESTGKFNIFSLTDKSQLVFDINRIFINRSIQTLTDLKISLILNNKEIDNTSLPVIKGGESFSYKYSLPIERIMENRQNIFNLVLLKGKKEILIDTAFNTWLSTSCIENLLSAIKLGEWEKSQSGDDFIFTKIISTPPQMEGFGIDISVDIGAVMSVMKVNGNTVKTKFWEESGDIHITASAKAGEKFKIEIIATPKDKNVEQVKIRNSYIYFRNRSAEKIIGNLFYTYNIINKYPIPISSAYSDILKSFRTNDRNILNNALGEVESKTQSLNPDIKNFTIHHIGHAHIDMAWLWRYPETIEVTRQTFRAALDNMKTFPDFKISHGQAQSYYWMEKYYPNIFIEVQKYVKEGRWEIVGGSWVESDANMPSGEFFLRQYIMGKRYFKEKFNIDVEIGFYPDTFGQCESLPMILDKSGIKIYIFFRPIDNQTIKYWEYKNGSKVLIHRPPEWYNSSGAWINSNATPDPRFFKYSYSTQKEYGLNDVMRFYGVGDHGGGPTIKEIENIKSLNDLKGYPNCIFSTFKNYYDIILKQNNNYTTTRGEFNPIFEGCYTSQAKTKYNNRRAEFFLPATETFCSIAQFFGFKYPKDTLDEAWRRVLMNQFHDILPGSGIGGVYTDAQAFYDTAFSLCEGAILSALDKIADQINTNSSKGGLIPLILFNPLNWQRSYPVEIRLKLNPSLNSVKVYDSKTNLVKSQVIKSGKDSVGFTFIAKDVPSIGYKTYWLEFLYDSTINLNPAQDDFNLENDYFRIKPDNNSGSISSIFDKQNSREIIKKNFLLNQYQIQEDAGDAWVISLQGKKIPLRSPDKIEVIEKGDVRKTIKISYNEGNSKYSQYIMLYNDLPIIYFYNEVDWKERKKMLKIAFPLDIENGKATYEIPFGIITRPSNGKEYVTQKFIDYSNSDFGVTLLNDSKYGCDVQDNIIRLTALRAPAYPDRIADSAVHTFSYAIITHNKSDINKTIRAGYEFNSPLLPYIKKQQWGKLPNSFSFFDKFPENIIVTTLKKSENDNNTIMRFYNTDGMETVFNINTYKNLKKLYESDALEWNTIEIKKENKKFNINLKPFDLKTIKIEYYK